MDSKRSRKIGVCVELTRSFGREICMGISEFARLSDGLEPVFISPSTLRSATALSSFDGFIVRVMNDSMAQALKNTGKPVVDDSCIDASRISYACRREDIYFIDEENLF